MINYKKFYLIMLVSILIIGTNIYAGELRDITISKIKAQFDENIDIETYKLSLSSHLKNDAEKFSKQRFWGNYVYYYKLKSNNELVGFAILDNVKGKVKPITYLVVFNIDNSVKSVDIIKYREQYGGAVGDEEWLKQFSTKDVNSELSLNDDIDGISGATISAKAVTKGVKRLLYLVNNIGENEKDLLVSIE